MRAIALHWTAGTYDDVFPAYHFCLRGRTDVEVVATHDITANLRDVRDGLQPYAAHVAGRNSRMLGVAVCGMRDATPCDFGAWPLTSEQLDALASVTRLLADAYAVPLVAIRTHAEFALEDGYFGAGDDERWDIARLRPSGEPLCALDARATGAYLRARVAAAR